MKTWQDIPGWFDFADIYDEAIARVPNGGTIVEIGCWLGRSSAYLYQAAAASGKSLTLVYVDSWTGTTGPSDHEKWDGGDMYKAWHRNMQMVCQRSQHICSSVFPMASIEAARRWSADSIDFIFLDAAHDYASVAADLDAWLPKLKPTGHIAGHDYGHLGVRRAVNERLTVRERGASWEMVNVPDQIREDENMDNTTDDLRALSASGLFAGVVALLARIASDHERANQSRESHGMIRALTADEIIEAKRLHDALSPANAAGEARAGQD